MLTPSQIPQQECTSINLENSNIISKLLTITLPEFSHAISHQISELSLEISYTLCNIEEDQPIITDKISQALCNFLEFYVIPNFILVYYSKLPTHKSSLEQNLLYFELHINNIKETLIINTEKILSQISFNKITITNVFKSTVSNLVESQLIKYFSTTSKKQLALSFDVIFNTPFNIKILNYHLNANLPIMEGILTLYTIINLYHTSPITDILHKKPTNLKLAIIHIQNPANSPSRLPISICVKINSTEFKHKKSTITFIQFIQSLCNNTYKYGSTILYEIDLWKLKKLNDLSQYTLTHHDLNYEQNKTIMYQLICNNAIKTKVINQLSNSINIFYNLYGSQHLNLSIEFLLKKNIIPEAQYVPKFSFEINTQFDIEEILCAIYFKGANVSNIRSFIRKCMLTNNNVNSILNAYDIYLYITPNKNLSTAVSSSIQRQNSFNTLTTIELNPLTTSQIQHIQNIDTKLTTLQSDINQESHTSNLSLANINTQTLTHPTKEEIEAPTSLKLASTIKTTEISASPLQHTTVSNHIQKDKQQIKLHNHKYKKKCIAILSCITALTAIIIGSYYIFINDLFANNKSFIEINMIVTLGIVCFFAILSTGTIMHYIIHCKMKGDYDITNNTIKSQDNTIKGQDNTIKGQDNRLI